MSELTDGRVPVFGAGDGLNWTTGFGGVMRGLFTRLPQDRFRLGYLSTWTGSRQFPGVTCYGHPSRFAVDGFPPSALDFAGLNGRFVLLTLMDPWMVSWISHPLTSPLGTPATRKFFRDLRGRQRFAWVGHFPIDGKGPREGPARWTEDVLNEMDLPVAMSEWGRRLVQPFVRREVRVIPHAVHGGFAPMDRAQARREVDAYFFTQAAREEAAKAELKPDDHLPDDLLRRARHRGFRTGDGFTAVCVMANRERKCWPEVLRAFALLAEDLPSARLIGVCGDRTGSGEDMWPLLDIAKELGLRLEGDAGDPNVALLDNTADAPGQEEDHSLRVLYSAADVAVLLSGGEGFGLPQLEAHACGVPCLVGDYSASTELAVDGRELIAPASWRETPSNMVRRPIYRPKDLAQRLKWAARNPEWRAEVGQAGAEAARKHRWDVILPQWTALLEEAGAMLAEAGAEPGHAQEAPDDREPAGSPAP